MFRRVIEHSIVNFHDFGMFSVLLYEDRLERNTPELLKLTFKSDLNAVLDQILNRKNFKVSDRKCVRLCSTK